MLSEKQLLANQQNALRSTGPRSAAGKAIASQNAIRHGLSAKITIIPGEDPEEFDQFRQMMLDDLAPAGALEVFLVDRIVAGSWKLRRAGRIETELFNEMDMPPQNPDSGGNKGEVPFNVVFTKTYTSPVPQPNLEQKEPPADGESCAVTPRPKTHESQTAVPTMTESDLAPPAQNPEESDLSSDGKESRTKTQQIPALGRLFKCDMAGGNIMARFRLYEGQIERSLYKALTELQKLQIMHSKRWISAADPSDDQTPALEP